MTKVYFILIIQLEDILKEYLYHSPHTDSKQVFCVMGCKIRSRRFYLDGKGNKYVPSSLESNNIQGNFCSNHLFSKFLTTKFSGISKVIHVSVI